MGGNQPAWIKKASRVSQRSGYILNFHILYPEFIPEILTKKEPPRVTPLIFIADKAYIAAAAGSNKFDCLHVGIDQDGPCGKILLQTLGYKYALGPIKGCSLHLNSQGHELAQIKMAATAVNLVRQPSCQYCPGQCCGNDKYGQMKPAVKWIINNNC